MAFPDWLRIGFNYPENEVLQCSLIEERRRAEETVTRMQRLDDLLNNATVRVAELEKEAKQWKGEHDMVRRDHASIIVENEELRGKLKDAED